MNEDLTCNRCTIGIDDDQDGNCGLCARWTDEEAVRVRHYVRTRLPDLKSTLSYRRGFDDGKAYICAKF